MDAAYQALLGRKSYQDYAREEQEFNARKEAQRLADMQRQQNIQKGRMEMENFQRQRTLEEQKRQSMKQLSQDLGSGQDIESLLATHARMTGDPSGYMDFQTQKALTDMKNRAELETLRQRQSISGGGVSSYMKDAQRLMEYNPELNPMEAYALARNGAGQGSFFNPETGTVEALPGYIPTRGSIKEGEAAGSARGTPLGEAQAEFADLTAAFPDLINVTSRLKNLSKVATYTKAGRFTDAVRRELGVNVGNAAEAAAEMATIVDVEVLPLLKPTFGAAFTVNEGQWLKATMGDPDMSPEEKSAQINARIAGWERRIKTLSRRTGEEIPEGLLNQQEMLAPQTQGKTINWSDLP